jgi:hypothetical protein
VDASVYYLRGEREDAAKVNGMVNRIVWRGSSFTSEIRGQDSENRAYQWIFPSSRYESGVRSEEFEGTGTLLLWLTSIPCFLDDRYLVRRERGVIENDIIVNDYVFFHGNHIRC